MPAIISIVIMVVNTPFICPGLGVAWRAATGGLWSKSFMMLYLASTYGFMTHDSCPERTRAEYACRRGRGRAGGRRRAGRRRSPPPHDCAKRRKEWRD